jgi:hypothetical protein
MHSLKTKIFKVLSLILLSGCGYQWKTDYPNGTRPTLMVPFIAKDTESLLTSEIISSLDASGMVDLVSKDGDYRLEVKIKGGGNAQIGYRRNPQRINGKIKKNLIPTEGRQGLTLEASLYRGCTKERVYGPYKLSVDAEYDYVDGDSFEDLTFISSSGDVVEVLPFSLGQLESVESAQEAVKRSLYRKMAQKIVDVISSEW